jgi:hypothetical protein
LHPQMPKSKMELDTSEASLKGGRLLACHP